ncbi:MAG TPA: c-type cytochrome [Rhodocyclaceae bacterium]|nr:c-type cytochrome [Rhodocyclaceae bacterium]
MIRTTAMALLLATSFVTNAAEEAKPKADPAKGKTVAETICVACHGADGNSPVSANPNLAGQVEDYIYKQLTNFKMVDGKPAARNNPIMMGMAAAVSDDDARNVAAWFSQQKLNPAPVKDETQIALGQKLWRMGDFKKGVPACAGCHGPAGAGLPAQYPRLAGQYQDYTEAQLKAFRQGERANDPEKMMRTIAAKLSDAEIKAVAEYAASLR